MNLQGKASTESESSEQVKDEIKTEEDDKKDVKTEEVKPETESSSAESPKDEKSAEKSAAAADDKKGAKSKKSEKADIKQEDDAESKSKDSSENQSSAKENDENKSKKKSKEVDKTDAQENVKKSENVQDKANETSTTSHDVYTGEVHDPNIKLDERHNYRPINIMFRRKCQNPQFRIQFDRTVILKNQTFYLNVDGKNVRLLASPQSVETYDDISLLLQIVDQINLSNCCVEPISQIS